MQEKMKENVKQRGPAKEYANESIVVFWEPSYCIHEAECIRGMPSVFDSRARPWIRVEGADADKLAETILKCPSGALSFKRLDGGAQEEPDQPMTIAAQPDGPLFVRGSIQIKDDEGEVIRETTRASLCRCGHSENKPYCDLSHYRVGFRTT
jgi:uncharacterized Fe-S cluster protein YjdI